SHPLRKRLHPLRARDAPDAAGPSGPERSHRANRDAPRRFARRPQEGALGEALRASAPAGAVDALARSIVVPMGPALRDRRPHLRELLEDELLLVLVVLDLEGGLAVADDAVRRRLPVLLFEQEAVRRDLQDVGEQGTARHAARLELDRDVVVSVHDDGAGPARQAWLL